LSGQNNFSSDNALSGITLLVFALFLFSLQDMTIKYFSDQYSVLQIVFIRGVIATTLMALAAKFIEGRFFPGSQKPWLTLSRGLLGFTSYTTYYLAVASMPLAEVVAIVFSAPLFVTAMSAIILREQVGPRRWAAVCAGFVGVLIIVGPSGQFHNLAVLLSFIAAITYALQTIITRKLGSHDKPLSIALNAMIVFTGASAILSLMLSANIISVTSSHPSLLFFARDWTQPETLDLALMIFLGFNGALAFFCMSKAYCVAPASTVAPFEYTYIIWAVIFGYLFWSEMPEPMTMIGISILIGSSIYIWDRERKIQKQVRPEPSIPTNELLKQEF
jgi:S-adenosylmethionine uptake transporter